MSDREVLCVELDGTLVRTSLACETLLMALRRQPWLLLVAPFWLMSGRAAFWERVARIASPDPALLPCNPEALDQIRAARERGQQVWLLTRCHRALAEPLFRHLGCFDELVARDDGTRPPAGASTTLALRDPAGPAPAGRVRTWLKAIRIHQWAKNLLIFLPIITAHDLLEGGKLAAGALAFVAFGLVASATYLVNDLMDLESDRAHARKRRRPLASGAIGIPAAALASVAMLAAGLLGGWQLPPAFFGALVVYTVTTLLYSFWLKRVASLDVVLLAGLYTLRVIAGALATGIELSFWLLAFSVFLFLCLALAKRVAELVELARKSGGAAGVVARGRQYGLEDIQVLQIMGIVSGYIAVLVLALYINSPAVAALYRTPELLWLIAPALLLWMTRLWMVTSRGYMDEDPVLFAIKDPETWATLAFTGAVLFGATLLDVRLSP